MEAKESAVEGGAQNGRIESSISQSETSLLWKSNEAHDRKTNRSFQKNFVLQDELGRGGFGFVYRCMNKKTRRVYAVKMNIDPKDIKGLLEEYMIISEICHTSGHPNIVNVIDCIADDKILYCIYELASGGDLSSHLKLKGYFPESIAGPIARQLFLGVSYIHFRGYLHRDIKPDNLLILQNSQPLHIKVSDFGLATRRHKDYAGRNGSADELDMYLPHNHGFAGTDKYMSPEVAHGEIPYDYECDVWSCGVTLYQMLVGYLPFDKNPVANKKFDPAKFAMPEWRGLETAIELITDIFDRSDSSDEVPLSIDKALEYSFFDKVNCERQPMRPDMSSAMAHFLKMTGLKKAFIKPLGQ